jgi:short-subunit dehydrogenase
VQELLRLISETRVDILVNNAGRGSFGLFDELDLEKEIEQVTLNVTASLRLAHAVIPQMKKRGSGAIVQISSIAGFQPIPFMATYAATKAFNLFHALALRHELKPFGVSVLAVCPGPTATEFGGVARVPGTSTGLARDDVQMVVRKSIAALSRNRAVVFPGLRASLVSLVPRLLPINISTAFMKRLLFKTWSSAGPRRR